MTALLRLRVRNFKSLRDVDVALAPLTVLVGPNASGKSNLLDVIQFLGDAARSDLSPALDIRGGFDRIRFRGSSKGSIEIEVEAAVTRYSSSTAPDDYTLTFGLASGAQARRKPIQLLLRSESIQFKRTAGRGRRFTVHGSVVDIYETRKGGDTKTKQLGLQEESLGLATLPKLSDQEGGTEIRKIADLFSTFRVFDVDVGAAREPAPMVESAPLAPDASNLAGFLSFLADSSQALFAQLVEDARILVPGLQEIIFEPVGGAQRAVELRLAESGLRGTTTMAEASFGTIRALALLALVYDPSPPLLTCIEEVDHGLHPYAFDLLVERLREASERTQFLIATHSPALVNRLKPEELVVCERGLDGASRIPAVGQDEVLALATGAEGHLGLGEIWFTGALGGNPAQ